MGRRFAGVLGLIAFSVVVVRGVIGGGGVFATLKAASCCLFAFAAVGYILGRIAAMTVEESVRGPPEEEPATPSE